MSTLRGKPLHPGLKVLMHRSHLGASCWVFHRGFVVIFFCNRDGNLEGHEALYGATRSYEVKSLTPGQICELMGWKQPAEAQS
jgi:hypothetical protein